MSTPSSPASLSSAQSSPSAQPAQSDLLPEPALPPEADLLPGRAPRASSAPGGPGGPGSALAPRNWRVAWRLIALVTIPTVLGLTLAGLRVSAATRSADTYSQVGRLAGLGRQVLSLAQAVEGERSDTAAFIAAGRPAAGLPALRRQYAITDRRAAGVRQLAGGTSSGYPARTRAGVAAIEASLAGLTGLRGEAAQNATPALTVISGYSAVIARLFPVSDGIADQSGNAALVSSVRALGSLSRMTDQAGQQQAILEVALARGSFGPGELAALTAAQARQASDMVSFGSSATPEESRALSETLAGPQAAQAAAVERSAIAAGRRPLALGASASQQWQAGTAYTIGWMSHAQQQLASWVSNYAQSLRRSAERSAIVTGAAALVALLLVLLVTILIVRSLVRPLRRLAAAADEVAGTRLPAEVLAIGMAGDAGPPLPVTPIDVLSRDEIGQVARAFDRVHREAVRLAGEEARLRADAGAISAGFFLRSHDLLERLLGQIDSLELSEDDPERLAGLFRLDHLATRMRRTSDSAVILAGHEIPGQATEPFALVDVLRAAVSEIEQYDRVVLSVQQSASFSGGAAADTVHLLAELLENATTFAPEGTQVVVSERAVRGGGVLIDITDRGPGMPDEQLRQLNWQLGHPFLADVADARRIGLFAVTHLAARHGITVTLGRAPDGGTVAEVYFPPALISPEGLVPDGQPAGWLGPADGEADGPARSPGVDWSAAGEPEPAANGSGAAREPSLTLSAPVPGGGEPNGARPAFAAAESGNGRPSGGMLRPSDPAAEAAGRPASGGLPRRIPRAGDTLSAAANQASLQAAAAEAAELAQGRLASFQRGSRRAQADRTAQHARPPGEEG